MSPTRPALRFHGGKWRIAPWIIQHLPAHELYVEPYGGAGSVLLRKPPSRGEVLNDLDGEIVNFFRVLRTPRRAKILLRAIELTPFSRREYKAALHSVKDPIERARRMAVRAYFGFGSDSYRPDRHSGFRGRFCGSGHSTSAPDWAHYPAGLIYVIERLRNVVIENREALDLIEIYDKPGTLFYCDPPYPKSTRSACSNGRHTYTFEMTDAQHEALAAKLQTIKGLAVISGYRCPLYDRLYAGWHRVDREALADGATSRTESLWLSDPRQAALFSTEKEGE